MKEREALSKLRAVMALVRGRGEVSEDEVRGLVDIALGGPRALSAKRAAAGRLGGRASAEARGNQPPKQTPKQTRSKTTFASEANSEANGKQTPEVRPEPRARSLDPSVSLPAVSLKNKAASEEPDRSSRAREPATAAATESEKQTLGERAKLVLENATQAAFLAPETWPEVRRVIDVFREATGHKNLSTGVFEYDRGIRAVVALFAGDPPLGVSEVEQGVRAAVASAWWRSGGVRRGLSSLTLEVVRRGLETPQEGGEGPFTRALREKREAAAKEARRKAAERRAAAGGGDG